MKTTNPKKKSEEKVGGYRFLAVLFFLLAVGGLFLGLLSNKLGDKLNGFLSLGLFFEPGGIANSDKILGGSLVGIVYGVILTMVDWFKAPNLANFNLFAGAVEGSTSKTQLITSYALLVLVVLLVVAVLASLISLIVAFASRKSAKRSAMASGILTFLSYGGLFLLAFATTCVDLESSIAGGTAKYQSYMFDFPTMAIAVVTLVVLVITAIARGKGMGFVNSICFLFTLAAFGALTYPSTQTALFIASGAFENAKEYLFVSIAMAALLALLAFNLLCGVCRLSARKGFLFDVVRYVLLLISAGVLVVALVLDKNFGEVFKADLIFTIVLLAATLLPVVFAILELVVAKKQAAAAKAKAKKEAAAKAAAEAEDDVPEIEMSNEGYIDEIVDDEIHRYVYEKRPEQPVQPVQPVQPEPQPQPEPAPQPIFQPNIIVQAPVPPQEEVKPREKTEFERRMEAIAREEEHPATATPASRLQRDGAPALTQPFTPVFTRQRKGKMQQMQMMDDEPASPYMAGNYDPFLSKLTSQEVSEFGDLFISNKYGMQNYLPVYVIGGDNSEFFNKVFIYLGRFRNYISSELLEKLNVYVSAIRTQK